MAHLFEDSVLFISARSPFARRVRLAFREHGIRYEERVADLFGPQTEELKGVFRLNPLGRVPVIQLAGGEVIVDSTQILQGFYSVTSSPWLPSSPADAFRSFHFTGLALGLCEKTVEWFLDSLRAVPDTGLRVEFAEVLERLLPYFEVELKHRDWVAGKSPTQADLDLGTALAYLSLRYSKEWQTNHPRCAEYLRGMEQRPSFLATAPPSA